MSNNKVKMHQIRFRLGLRPRPYTGSLQRSPNPPAGFKGPTFKLREGRGKEWREGTKKGEEKGKGEKFLRICSALRCNNSLALQDGDVRMASSSSHADYPVPLPSPGTAMIRGNSAWLL